MVGQRKPPYLHLWKHLAATVPNRTPELRGLCQRTMAPGFSGSWQYKISLNQNRQETKQTWTVCSPLCTKVATCCMKRKEMDTL